MNDLNDTSQVLLKPAPDHLLKNVNLYQYQRTTSDLYLRSLIGPVFYLLASILVAFYSGYGMLRCTLSIGVYLFLWGARYLHRPPDNGASIETYQFWIRRHWLTIYAGVSLWSVIAVQVGWHQQHVDDAMVVVLATTIAFGTATCHSFIMQPQHARLCIALLLLPSSFAYIVFIPDLQSSGWVLLAYFAYLMANSIATSREYQNQMATEIQLLESRAEITRVSMTDALTGIANRRSYEYVWNNLWHLSARNQDVLAFLIIDLDFFKAINDQYGHLAGDLCLQHVARILRENIQRESDLIARIGGEEFAVILPGTALEQAYLIAEQLRTDFGKEEIYFENHQLHISASIGVGIADWSRDMTPDNTFSRVDQACYQAKQNGRDCVIRANPI